VTPNTAANFKRLVTGEKGFSKMNQTKKLHYKGVTFHRIVSDFIAQAGDIIKGDGSSGESIFGGSFNDEKGGLKLKFGGKGILAMANSGKKNTNTSQFFITMTDKALPQLNGKHVIFGQVVEGLELLDDMNRAASASGTPSQSVIIQDCGLLS
jgi:cyclophilin family peptidyl-prolyl cis-trans isomerase